MRLLPSTLQKRFLVGLLLIVLITATFFYLTLRNHMKELYLSEAHSKASLMEAHTEAIQHYVREVLRPAVSDQVGRDEFIIEAMSSSYVTRHILEGLNFASDDFTYRRVAKNARNPVSEVNAREALFFEKFLQTPDATRMEERVLLNGREQLVIARPVYFDESCMRCHGDPADAPAVMLAMYGDERGFWRQPDELAGLNIVSVPMESPGSAIGKSITIFALCFAAGMIMLLLAVQGFFNRLVVHNLRRVGHILHQNFFREERNAVLASLHKEVEIESMIHSIEIVAAHLSTARRQLSDYAKNLEGMVGERTQDLESVVQRRSADVHLFMRLLSDLNNTQDKKALLQTSLCLIAGHFGACRAAYACGISGSSYVEWPAEEVEQTPERQEVHRQLLAQLRLEEAARLDAVWYIPVQSSGQTRGMLALYWDGKAPLPDTARNVAETTHFSLALALGRQLGIALDNLDALDVLLRQNSLLDAIVEGVSDPLILVEHDMIPVLTNSSARALAVRLLPRHGDSCRPEKDGKLPDDTACIAALLAHLGLREPERLTSPVQREISLPDGTSFTVGIHPLAMAHSGDLRAVLHLRETTEEKRILSYMRQSDKLAAVGQLAAGLAHEINNPLGVIQCYAELMSGTDIDEQSRTDLDVILRHVNQARSVLNDMLDFSRTRESRPGPCDINELLCSVTEIFSAQGRAARVEFIPHVEQDLPKPYADRRMLEQVVINLLINARDAVKKCRTPGSGRIELSARHDRAAGHVVIAVTDNGHGIPEGVLPKVFDPFFTTKEPGAGTGLGLTVAFGMVADMGGRLEVLSPLPGKPPGTGTSFHIILPLSQKEEYHVSHAEHINS